MREWVVCRKNRLEDIVSFEAQPMEIMQVAEGQDPAFQAYLVEEDLVAYTMFDVQKYFYGENPLAGLPRTQFVPDEEGGSDHEDLQ